MKRSITTAAACLAMTFATYTTARAADAVSDKVEAMTSPADSKGFAMKAAEDGMLEVKLSEIVATKAQSSQVKEFAQRMIQDHTQANNELMALAKSKNITLPGDLKGECKSTYEAFQKLSGPDLDSSYVLFMVKDHLHDIAAFTKEAQSGTDADVKAFAAKTLPTLRQHAGMLRGPAMAANVPLDALTGSGGAMGAMDHDHSGAQPAGSRQTPADSRTGAGTTGNGTSK